MSQNDDYRFINRFPAGYRVGLYSASLVARPMLFGKLENPAIRMGMWTIRVGFYACVCLLSVTAGEELEASMMDKLEGKDGFRW